MVAFSITVIDYTVGFTLKQNINAENGRIEHRNMDIQSLQSHLGSLLQSEINFFGELTGTPPVYQIVFLVVFT